MAANQQSEILQGRTLGEEPEWLTEQRRDAHSRFNSLPMPSFKYGLGILVDVSMINLEELDPAEQQDDVGVQADHRITVIPLQQAWKTHGEELKSALAGSHAGAKEQDTKLRAHHAAFLNSGLVIHIPHGIKSDQPTILNLYQNASARVDHVLVLAEEGSEAAIIDYSSTPNDSRQRLRNQAITIIAKDNASVHYTSVQDMAEGGYHFSSKNAKAGAGASITWTDCCIGGTFTQSKTSTSLDGMKASGTIRSIFFGGPGQRYDLYAGTTHHAPQTTSDLRARGVLTGDARSTFRGLIRMESDAKGCEGFQKEEALLIGGEAKADAVPILEIENNDVKCGHATSIGYVDEEKLFYMASRGLSEEEARQQIVEGFLGSLVQEINNEKTRQRIMEKIQEQLA
ncbi:Fe-S cluster assembly protein SufD [Candidatus Woesearchaeota archaeon]|nr:Fe-S cluster assembly protein SufD [Candidatus Woesearchaeota archaeon]